MQQLHDMEINSGVQTFFDGDIHVWIGDGMNGLTAEARCSTVKEASTWLRERYEEAKSR